MHGAPQTPVPLAKHPCEVKYRYYFLCIRPVRVSRQRDLSGRGGKSTTYNSGPITRFHMLGIDIKKIPANCPFL